MPDLIRQAPLREATHFTPEHKFLKYVKVNLDCELPSTSHILEKLRSTTRLRMDRIPLEVTLDA
jgi:hypothetical protein